MWQVDHVTVQEAAQYLRISIATVYRSLRSGKLTGVKVKPQGAKGSLRDQPLHLKTVRDGPLEDVSASAESGNI